MNELVSIIIPVFNYGRFLAEALDSVMAQSYRPVEVIVVDDGSTDNTREIALSFPEIQYFYQKNQGEAVARNTGIAKARGKYIAFLDADDTWLPDKLKIQIQYLEEHTGLGCTFCKIQNFIEPGVNLDPKAVSSLLESDQIGLATIVTKKDIFAQVGGFDSRYKVGTDFDWFVRARDAGITMVILPDILLNRRIHNENISTQNLRVHHALRLQILKESIERQRKKKTRQDGEK